MARRALLDFEKPLVELEEQIEQIRQLARDSEVDVSQQLLQLETLATFGETELRKPYGLWVSEHASGQLEVLVTDAYMAGEDAQGEDILPPLDQLDRRIHRYRVRADALGRWAFHCHLLYHMEAGMMREVRIEA